jgi:hypothetical protein
MMEQGGLGLEVQCSRHRYGNKSCFSVSQCISDVYMLEVEVRGAEESRIVQFIMPQSLNILLALTFHLLHQAG